MTEFSFLGGELALTFFFFFFKWMLVKVTPQCECLLSVSSILWPGWMEKHDFLATAAQETVKPAEICQFAPCRCPQCRKRKKENGRERQDSFQSITLTGFYTEWRAMHQILGGSPELGIICNNIHSSIHSMAVTFSLSWFSFSHPFLVSFSETILGLIIILIE